MKNSYFQIFLETIPIFIGIILSYLFWKNNILLSFLYILLIVIVLSIKHQKGDIPALVYGVIIGLIVEIVGTSISGYQSFTNPDFLGVPLWLPISWGYGLMIMKRIGVLINEK